MGIEKSRYFILTRDVIDGQGSWWVLKEDGYLKDEMEEAMAQFDPEFDDVIVVKGIIIPTKKVVCLG